MTGRARALVLAGGRSSRFGAPDGAPKPLAEVDGRRLLDHVLDRHTDAGIDEVVVALGHHRDAVLAAYDARPLGTPAAWTATTPAALVTFIDTGTTAGTGGRVGLASGRLTPTFHLSWCDGLLDVDPRDLEAVHGTGQADVTVVTVHPPTRFGRLWLDGEDRVVGVAEKPLLDDVWVSAGVFVVDRAAIAGLLAAETSWEHDVLPRLAKDGRLRAHRHDGFFAAVDTPYDLARLHERTGDHTARGRRPWQLPRA